jgi:hypothetical protein
MRERSAFFAISPLGVQTGQATAKFTRARAGEEIHLGTTRLAVTFRQTWCLIIKVIKDVETQRGI